MAPNSNLNSAKASIIQHNPPPAVRGGHNVRLESIDHTNYKLQPL